jgi:hypothetical protein
MCSSPGVCHLAAVPDNGLAINRGVNAMRGSQAAIAACGNWWRCERSKALAWGFNCREGFTATDDRQPKRPHEALTGGPLQGVRIDPETVRRALRLSCPMAGGDPEASRPTFAGLAKRGIEGAAKLGDARAAGGLI